MAVAILFPGQGSQFPGMADPWTEHAAGLAVLEEASEAMGRDVVAGCRDEQALSTTEFVQPADRKSTRLNSSHIQKSRMPSSA